MSNQRLLLRMSEMCPAGKSLQARVVEHGEAWREWRASHGKLRTTFPRQAEAGPGRLQAHTGRILPPTLRSPQEVPPSPEEPKVRDCLRQRQPCKNPRMPCVSPGLCIERSKWAGGRAQTAGCGLVCAGGSGRRGGRLRRFDEQHGARKREAARGIVHDVHLAGV